PGGKCEGQREAVFIWRKRAIRQSEPNDAARAGARPADAREVLVCDPRVVHQRLFLSEGLALGPAHLGAEHRPGGAEGPAITALLGLGDVFDDEDPARVLFADDLAREDGPELPRCNAG